MAKTIRIRVTTNVRRVGPGTYRITTSTKNGASTKTTSKTVRAR